MGTSFAIGYDETEAVQPSDKNSVVIRFSCGQMADDFTEWLCCFGEEDFHCYLEAILFKPGDELKGGPSGFDGTFTKVGNREIWSNEL
jgi:hypothetical protein